jgi:hypothetical protein
MDSMPSHVATPSVGGITKKILAIRPDLRPAELIEIVRLSIRRQAPPSEEFSVFEIVDEELALRLTRELHPDSLSPVTPF